MRGTWAAVMLWVGCKGTEPPPERLLDTGWFDDTGLTVQCADRIDAVTPEDGVGDFYWRDAPRIFTTSRDDAAYQVFLSDSTGALVDATREWDAESNRFDLRPSQPLQANTDYQLRLVDCEGTRDVAFRTSELGLPLIGGAGALAGRTYDLRLQQATWLEPGGVAPLLTLYFDTPVIIGVPLADANNLHLNLALAWEDDQGELNQFLDEPAIGFPLVDFASQPYFEAATPTVELDFTGVTIPVYDFEFSGTFAADGSRIGGGTVQGIGDSRFAGPLLGNDSPGEVCDVAAGLGVQCMPCPTDNEPYCLPVSVVDVEGVWVPGLTVQAL